MSASKKEEGGKSGGLEWRRASEVVIVILVLILAGLGYQIVELSASISLDNSEVSALKSELANTTAEVENLTSVVRSLSIQLNSVEESNSSALEVIATMVVTPPSQGRNLSVTIYAAVYNTLNKLNIMTAESTGESRTAPVSSRWPRSSTCMRVSIRNITFLTRSRCSSIIPHGSMRARPSARSNTSSFPPATWQQ